MGIYFAGTAGGLVAGAGASRLVRTLLDAGSGRTIALVPIAAFVGVSEGVTRGADAVFFFNSSSNFRPPSTDWCARMAESSSDRPRNTPAEYLVILVSAVPDSAPHKASVAPPPNAIPAPASFFGSLIRISSINNRQS